MEMGTSVPNRTGLNPPKGGKMTARRATDAAHENGAGGAVSLRTWLVEAEAAGSIARQVVGTPFVPDSLKRWQLDQNGRLTSNLDYEATVATVASALLAGQELGFGPMASLRSIDVIHDTPALRAIALRALVQTHGHDIWVVESTSSRAIVRAQRRDGEVQQSTWDIPRARLLGLYPGRENGQWRRQPQAQLVARATAEVARWVDSDGILGLPYIAEELIDAEHERPPADEAAEGDGTAAGKRTVKRRRQLPAGLAIPPQSGPAEPPPPETRPAGRPIQKGQLEKLTVKLREAGITSRTDANALVAGWIGRAVPNANDLTQVEGRTVLEKLDEMIATAAQREHQDQAAEQGQAEPPADDETGQEDTPDGDVDPD